MSNKSTSDGSGLGGTLSYICKLIYIFAPLLVLELDLVISLFLLVIIMIVPLWGEVLRFILYVWAFTQVIARPVDYISFIFYICAALYLAEYIIGFLSRLREK